MNIAALPRSGSLTIFSCNFNYYFSDASAERRTEERSQIGTQYTETVSKLIHNLGEIEQIATNDMYTEQSWVEQLLKRVRNEADSATKGMF